MWLCLLFWMEVAYLGRNGVMKLGGVEGECVPPGALAGRLAQPGEVTHVVMTDNERRNMGVYTVVVSVRNGCRVVEKWGDEVAEGWRGRALPQVVCP